MDYTEILLVQAKKMAQQLQEITGEPAFNDPRFITSLHTAFCIIRNDTRTFVIGDMLIGKEIAHKTPAQQEKIKQFVLQYATINEIPLPANEPKK